MGAEWGRGAVERKFDSVVEVIFMLMSCIRYDPLQTFIRFYEIFTSNNKNTCVRQQFNMLNALALVVSTVVAAVAVPPSIKMSARKHTN